MEGTTVTVMNHRSGPEATAVVDSFCLGREGWLGCWSGDDLGTGPMRNKVIQESEKHFGRGKFLYLGDNDCLFLQPDWLKILTETYREAHDVHGFAVLAAYNHPFNRPIAPTIRTLTRWNVNEVYAVATQSMLMSWDIWDRFGPFCDTPAGKVCQSEDIEFCNRIRAAGMKVGVISPALLVNTGITNSFGQHIPGWELVKSQCPEGVICE
jgi:hypothetical protein